MIPSIVVMIGRNRPRSLTKTPGQLPPVVMYEISPCRLAHRISEVVDIHGHLVLRFSTWKVRNSVIDLIQVRCNAARACQYLELVCTDACVTCHHAVVPPASLSENAPEPMDDRREDRRRKISGIDARHGSIPPMICRRPALHGRRREEDMALSLTKSILKYDFQARKRKSRCLIVIGA